jgi:hypothetical protein
MATTIARRIQRGAWQPAAVRLVGWGRCSDRSGDRFRRGRFCGWQRGVFRFCAAPDRSELLRAPPIRTPSELSKSQLYQDALPLINSRTAALLDNTTLRRQLVTLERKTTRGGKDSIDHSPGAKDDLANAVCGALVYAGKSLGDPNFWRGIPYPKANLV